MIKKLIIYGLGIFFSKVIVFLLVPVYTRCFSTADYGYYDVLISNITMVVSITFVEVWSGIIRFIFDDERPYRPIKSFLVILPALLVLYAVGIVVLAQIMELKFVVLTVVYGLLYLLFTVYNSICRGLGKNVDYVISGVISTVLACGLGVLFVVVLKRGIASLLVAQIIGYACAVVYSEIRTRAVTRSFKEKISKQQIKEMILYCIPLMVNSFSFLFLGTFNKNVVLKQLGEDVSGYYAFVLKFTSILSVLISVFSLAWQEVAFQNANNKDRDKIFTYYLNEFVRFVGLLVPVYCLVLYYAAPIIGGAKYTDTVQYLPLAIFATFISEFSGVLSVVIAVSKHGLHILLSTIVGAAANIAISLCLTKIIGIDAASLGLFVGFLIAGIYRFIAGRRKYKISVKCGALLALAVEMFLTVLCFYFGKWWLILPAILMFLVLWGASNRHEFKTAFRKAKAFLCKTKKKET